MTEVPFFEFVLDAFEGFSHAVDGDLHATTHRRGIKVWYDDAAKEHYEAQLIGTDAGVALEIGFHVEYPKVESNDAVIERITAREKAWRKQLGPEPEVGEFIGSDRWRRISELWEAPDPDDDEASIEIAARLAEYVEALEPIRRT